MSKSILERIQAWSRFHKGVAFKPETPSVSDSEVVAELLRLEKRIALLEAAIRNHKACGGEPVDSERLYSVLQEDKP